MADSQQIQALKRIVADLEKQAAIERQETATWLEKLKPQYEIKALEDRQDQELQTLSVNYSHLQQQHKSLLQRHVLLLDAFTDVKSMTFEEYISAETDKVAQNQMKAIREEI